VSHVQCHTALVGVWRSGQIDRPGLFARGSAKHDIPVLGGTSVQICMLTTDNYAPLCLVTGSTSGTGVGASATYPERGVPTHRAQSTQQGTHSKRRLYSSRVFLHGEPSSTERTQPPAQPLPPPPPRATRLPLGGFVEFGAHVASDATIKERIQPLAPPSPPQAAPMAGYD
jgi:hypothetical protein